jgi:hypothetical protein
MPAVIRVIGVIRVVRTIRFRGASRVIRLVLRRKAQSVYRRSMRLSVFRFTRVMRVKGY